MPSQLYLKYRPKQLDDLVGQKSIIATLKQASAKNSFAHAYMLGGERGCGKTSTSRIMATLMTCEDVKDGKVCGKCRACETIGIGSSVDVREYNGATSRGIDDIKDIIESAQWAPQELKRKVYIIDEVHQLTKEAVSALLKILEEPPAYLTFILCTTETKKIFPTILSRCQRFNFRKLSSNDMIERLKYISSKENINIEEKALYIIAKMARGSMRDAVSYLEQVGTAGADKKINETNIQNYFGVSDRSGIINMVKAIKENNLPKLLDQVNDLIVASIDIKGILFEITEVFRNIMLLKAYRDAKALDLPDYEIKAIQELGEGISMEKLIKMSHTFSEIDKKIEFNINERWVMEATLIKCSSILNTTD